MTNDKQRPSEVRIPHPGPSMAGGGGATPGPGAAMPKPAGRPAAQNAPRMGAVPMAAPGAKGQAGGPANGPGAATPGAPGPKPGATKRTVLIVVGLVVAALAIWLLVWLFACNGSSLFDPTAQTGQAPYKSAEEMQAELDRTVEEGMFNISISSVIQFQDGTSSGTAYIENVPGNRYNMQVTITDDDTDEVLYESGVLAPNQFIESIVLAKDLDEGTYPATATFKAIDPTTYDEVGQAAAKVTISVLG